MYMEGSYSHYIAILDMELAIHTILFIFSLFTFFVYFRSRGKKYADPLPPGSFGLPVIGQTPSLLRALKDDKIKEWLQERTTKYGPIWKSRLFGEPTVFLHGPAANKFIYTNDGDVLASSQPPSFTRIIGPKNMTELSGSDHKRVRGPLVSFLKPEMLKQYVAKVDEEIQHHLQMNWHGKHEVQVQPLMKTLTFDVIGLLLFGMKRGSRREKMLPLLQDMFEGFLGIPINFPFTRLNRALIARQKLIPMVTNLIHEKKVARKKQDRLGDTHTDLITSYISIGNDDSSMMLSNEEIIDNILGVMTAGYDTTAVLISFFIKLLASNESIYTAIVREHEEIAKSKASEEALSWEDLTKMKCTSRVTSEILRMYPPATMNFRRTKKDIKYGGFIIPKGWQVMLSPTMTHMDSSIFENPTMFDPTRFEKHAPSPPPFSLVPFGAGPRMCPGMELAKMETLVMIHRLVTQFKWELLKKDESFKRTPMPKFDHGLLVTIKPIK